MRRFWSISAVLATLVLLGGVLVAAQANPVTNGDFEGGFTYQGTSHALDLWADDVPNGWTRVETFTGGGAEQSIVTDAADNGPSLGGVRSLATTRLQGGTSGDWTAVQQGLDIDASQCSALTLNMDVKVHTHNLEAGGWVTPAFEWPVIVQIDYDTTGGGSQIWRHGWYISPPGDSSSGPINDPGDGLIPFFNDEQVAPSTWDTNSFDLFTELPQLGTITRIRVGGSGWNFEGQVDNVEIICERPPVGGVTLPPALSGTVVAWLGLAVLCGLLLVGGALTLTRRLA